MCIIMNIYVHMSVYILCKALSPSFTLNKQEVHPKCVGDAPLRSGQGPIMPAQGLEQLDADEKAEASEDKGFLNRNRKTVCLGGSLGSCTLQQQGAMRWHLAKVAACAGGRPAAGLGGICLCRARRLELLCSMRLQSLY